MKKIIITEGRDDKRFFIGLLSYLKIKDVDVFAINKKSQGGKSRVLDADFLQYVINAETQNLESKILITCDADFVEQNGHFSGFEKSKLEASEILKTLKKQSDKNLFEFFIMPNNKDDGNLESLYLESLSKDQRVNPLNAGKNFKKALNCVERYFSCLSSADLLSKKNSKIKALSLLLPMGSNEDIYSVGFAACLDEKNKIFREGYWNFESEALGPLNKFLQKFFN